MSLSGEPVALCAASNPLA